MWAACALQSVGAGSEQAVSSDFSSTCCNKLHACVIGMRDQTLQLAYATAGGWTPRPCVRIQAAWQELSTPGSRRGRA